MKVGVTGDTDGPPELVLIIEEGAVLERRRRVHQNTNAATRARKTTPPTTPPAIGPALDELETGADVGVEELAVDFGTAVDSGKSTAFEAAMGSKLSFASTFRYA